MNIDATIRLTRNQTPSRLGEFQRISTILGEYGAFFEVRADHLISRDNARVRNPSRTHQIGSAGAWTTRDQVTSASNRIGA